MRRHNAMSEWIKVVTHPLGLVGFVLFLIFGLLAKAKYRAERRWLYPAAVAFAMVALLGGLGLAYFQVRGSMPAVQPQAVQAPSPSQQGPTQVQQTVTGAGGVAVEGVEGDLTITVDQSSGKTETSKPPEKTPKQKRQQ